MPRLLNAEEWLSPCLEVYLVAHHSIIDRGKVPSLVTLCDNRPKVLRSKRPLSPVHPISNDEGVSTHAQDWYVESQQRYTGWCDGPATADVLKNP